MDALASSAIGMISEFRPQDFGNTAWAYAKLVIANRPLLDALSAAAIRSLSHFPPQNLANIAWALATLSINDRPLLNAIASAAIRRLGNFNSQHLAHMFWSMASLGVFDKPFLEALSAEAIRKIGDFNPQELSNTAWACARMGFIHQPLLAAIASAVLRRIHSLVPQDFANILWSFSKLGYVHMPLLSSIAKAVIHQIRNFNPQDLANTAWAVANLRVRDGPLMQSISSQVGRKIATFEGSDFSTTAWAFSALGLDHEELQNAISSEVLKKISSLGAQQLGTLVDLGLPCHDAVARRLEDVVSHFLLGIPSSITGFRQGEYARHVELFEVDNFGSVGDRHLLTYRGVLDPDAAFRVRAKARVLEHNQQHLRSWWRTEGLLHARVLSYAEFDLAPGHGGPALFGHRFQQNGYHGSRESDEYILPTTLPFNHNVDRGLCSEYQLLARLCSEVIGTAANGFVVLANTTGAVQLYVSGAPCLSCIGAMCQFGLLLPRVSFGVSIGEELPFDACAAMSVARDTLPG